MPALLERPAVPLLERVDWHPSELRRVVIRLASGETVQVGTAPNRESGMTLARSVVAELESPSGEWPSVGDRHLTPESIVSVDVVRM